MPSHPLWQHCNGMLSVAIAGATLLVTRDEIYRCLSFQWFELTSRQDTSPNNSHQINMPNWLKLSQWFQAGMSLLSWKKSIPSSGLPNGFPRLLGRGKLRDYPSIVAEMGKGFWRNRDWDNCTFMGAWLISIPRLNVISVAHHFLHFLLQQQAPGGSCNNCHNVDDIHHV